MVARLLVGGLLLVALGFCSRDPEVTGPEGPPADSTSNPPPDTSSVEIITKVVADQLDFPWELVWGPDSKIWFTERPGRISKLDPETGNITPLLTINDVYSVSESGLLGMAIPPDVSKNPYLFVAYTYKKNGQNTLKVVRYNYSEESLTDPFIVLDDVRGGGIHNGCRLLVAGDKLFITTGDSNDQSLPQNLSSNNGKILRVNFDGSVPSDNPDPSTPVWSYGHRNAQGLVLANDSLFSSEHGPDTDDEINIIHKGANYGWPDVKGECDGNEQEFCDEHHVVPSIKSWTPTIAPSGMEYYSGDEIPQWRNSLLLCTLKDERLIQLKLNGEGNAIISGKEYFVNAFGRLRDACISPGGVVYICTSNGGDDKIVEIRRK